MILSFLASCCVARPLERRSRDLGEVPMWLGGPQSGLFERRLSNIMGVHREVGFHPDQQQQGTDARASAWAVVVELKETFYIPADPSLIQTVKPTDLVRA